MGKRSSFTRRDRDFYPTPKQAVLPLLPHLGDIQTFGEPMAGDGSLIDHLEETHLECSWASDIEPQRKDIKKLDVFDLDETNQDIIRTEVFITNPPLSRKVLHEVIPKLAKMKPTWLLFDSDWMFTLQSRELIKLCRKIVAVGRLKWLPDSAFQSKDSCGWYYFDT